MRSVRAEENNGVVGIVLRISGGESPLDEIMVPSPFESRELDNRGHDKWAGIRLSKQE